ncbi:MAG: MobF family relaxase [Acidimicrobiales bacterium]
MLTIAKLGIGQQNYYLSKVASGIEDYYSGRGEVAGTWNGRGASRLGLAGRVRAGQLAKLMDGLDPLTGDRLAGREGVARVPGWDLTFSAPKTVSVLYGLSDARIAAEVVAAHEAAVAEGIAYLERYAACSRRRTDGDITTVRAEGLAGAAFRHRTSRAGDPQLHTHALAVNLVGLVDGGWGALHSPIIYRHARTAGFVYQAVLRGELTDRLGVAWDEAHMGHAEIAGIDPMLVQVFSKRRHEIIAAMERRGEHSARAAQVAAHATRSTKEYGVDPDSLRQRWADEALAAGVAPASLQQAIGHPPRAVTTGQLEHAVEVMVSARGLTQHDATFDRRDVMRAWCEALPAGTKVRLTDLVALCDDLLAHPDVETIRDGLDRLRGHEIVYRADGTLTTASHVEPYWSTREMLAIERSMLDMAQQARTAGTCRVPAEHVERCLASRPDLSAEQAAMVRQVTTSSAGVELVVGRAGTGKTYALAVAARAWGEAGFHVMGLALAARAADQLEHGAGIRSATVARFLCDADRISASPVTDRHVLVVDEAGMVDTRRLARVIAIARHSGAKVLLVGDHHQLPAVEAGGAFAALITEIGATELCENRRQVEPWERRVLEQLRTGSPEHGGIPGVLAAYQREGRLHVGVSAAQVRRDMVQTWYTEHSQGRNVGMIALRRRDVDDLNSAARALLVADGTVTDDAGIRVGPTTFGTGDRVVCTRGDRWLGVHNALFATIVDTDPATGAIAIQPDGRSRDPMCIPHWFVTAGYLRHAYATTIHKAQGATYDHPWSTATNGSTGKPDTPGSPGAGSATTSTSSTSTPGCRNRTSNSTANRPSTLTPTSASSGPSAGTAPRPLPPQGTLANPAGHPPDHWVICGTNATNSSQRTAPPPRPRPPRRPITPRAGWPSSTTPSATGADMPAWPPKSTDPTTSWTCSASRPQSRLPASTGAALRPRSSPITLAGMPTRKTSSIDSPTHYSGATPPMSSTRSK